MIEHPHSYSRAHDFLACRWMYRAKYVWRLPAAPSWPLAFGRFEHALIEAYVLHLIRVQKPSDLDAIDAVWADVVRRRGGSHLEVLMVPALELLRKFATGFRLDLEHVWKPEARLAVDVEGNPVAFDDPNAWVRGVLDLVMVDGTEGRVNDWKTARAPGTEAAMSEGLQPATYAFLLWRNNPRLSRIIVEFHYVRWNLLRRVEFDTRTLQDAWDRWRVIGGNLIDAIADVDDAQRWKPTPGSHCSMCPVAMQCPLLPESFMDPDPVRAAAILTADEAVEDAGRLLVLQARIATLRARLRTWVGTHGPVTVGDLRWDYWPKEGLRYPIHQVMRLAEKYFMDPARLLRVNTGALKRTEKKMPGLLMDLKPYALPDNKTTFAARKPEPTEEERLIQAAEDEAAQDHELPDDAHDDEFPEETL
jgi:hypothetical protein